MTAELADLLDRGWEEILRRAREAGEEEIRQKIAEISGRLDALQRDLDDRLQARSNIPANLPGGSPGPTARDEGCHTPIRSHQTARAGPGHGRKQYR